MREHREEVILLPGRFRQCRDGSLAFGDLLDDAAREEGQGCRLGLGQLDDQPVAGGALVVVGVLILAALLRYLLRELLRAAGLGATDRFFGALFGIARGLAVAFVVVLIGGLAGVAKEPWWRDALFSAPLESAVIAAKPGIPWRTFF